LLIIVIIISSIILASLSGAVAVYAVKQDTLKGDVAQALVTNQNSGFELLGANGKTRQDTTSAVNFIHGLLGDGCNQQSGSLFPLFPGWGFEVICKAIDKPENVAIKSFKIKVQDRTPPAVEPCPLIFDISDMKETGYSFFFKIRTTLFLKGIADCPSPPPPPPPVADAGKDFEISEAKIGHLDGSKSLTYEGGKLYYTWKQIGGTYSKLSNSHSPAPKFMAPKVDKDSKLKFELTVTNSRGVSTSDLVSVTVRNVITRSYDITGSYIGGVHDGPGINFATAGDWGCNTNTRQTMDNIDSINPELLLALGDYSYSNSATCWLDIIKPLDSNTRIAIGNHEDEISEGKRQYLNHFGLSKSYYSFEYGNIHVLVIDSEQDIDVGSSQYDFVRNDLQLASNDPSILWKLVIFHHPPYTSPTSCSACEPLNSLRDAVHPLFDKYGVDLVLMGHVHNYQRSFPLKYNANHPSEPIITSSNEHNYLDPLGQIYTIVGTAGINFHALSGKESYIEYQQDSKFGFLNIHFSKDGKTMNSKFISNDGSVMDQFSIKKSQIQKNKKIDDKNPTADAGDDQKVQVGNEVKLDGSQSTDNDGKIVSFKWEQTDGPKVNLNSDQDKAMFVVPDSATDSMLAFKLTVVDDKGATSSDNVMVQVEKVQKNVPPTADAGDDQKVQVGNEVKLDGSQSTDNDGKIVSFKWEQTEGPKVNLHSDQDKATFVVPDSATDSKLAFKLTVVDDKDATSSDNVIVQVEKVQKNVPPTANDQKASVDKNGQIDISLIGNDHKASIQFEIVSGPSDGRLINFDENKGIVTYIPKKDYTGDDEFKFRVIDNKRTASNIATVNVNVKEINLPLNTSENISRLKATLLQNGTNVHHDLILSSFTIDNGKLNILSSDYPKKATFRLQQNLPINIVSKNGDSNVLVKDVILHDDENNPYHLKMNRDNNWIPNVPLGSYKIEIQGKYSQGNENLVSFVDRVEILKNIKVN